METFVFALGVMVALVPEGLPATLSVSPAIGVRRTARRHALVKQLLAVEALGSTTVVCTDKTGTLTQAEMTVVQVWAGGVPHAVSGVRYASVGEVADPDACEPAFLEHAGALTADLVIAATGNDEDNLVISLLAKRQFTVPRVAARVNDAENTWLFDQSWGVDTAVPAATPLVSLIEEATGATDTVALLRLSRAGVDVIETAITPRSRAAGRTLAEITLPTGSVIATVIREGQPTVPAPEMRLQPGDELLVVSHAATEQEIHSAFQ